MKFYLIAFALLLVVLVGLAAVFDEPSPSSAPLTSSGPDDSAMKTLKID